MEKSSLKAVVDARWGICQEELPRRPWMIMRELKTNTGLFVLDLVTASLFAP